MTNGGTTMVQPETRRGSDDDVFITPRDDNDAPVLATTTSPDPNASPNVPQRLQAYLPLLIMHQKKRSKGVDPLFPGVKKNVRD